MQWGQGVASILPFLPRGVFDDGTTLIMGEAFDAACRDLRDVQQRDLVREIMAKKIIEAARKGEKDVTSLRDIALAAVTKDARVKRVT